MLPGISKLEFGRLHMSIGYGTHKKGRPLSPVEVGMLLRRAREAGASLQDCAQALNGTSHLSRFLRILDLASDLLHLIGWGAGSGDSIGFSSAVELAQICNADDQRIVATAILESGLQSREVRQVAQLRNRSKRPIRACLEEVLGMRPSVEKRYVFIGAVGDKTLEAALGKLSQAQRNAVLQTGINTFGLSGVSGRLGERLFTLVGTEQFNTALRKIGKQNLEMQIRTLIAENSRNVRSDG
jgi:hypothetical protein